MHPKTSAAGIAGAVTAILVWLLTTYGHIAVPPDVAAALTALIAAAASYLTAPGETPPGPAK